MNGQTVRFVDLGHGVKNTPDQYMDSGVDTCAVNIVSRKERLFFRDGVRRNDRTENHPEH